jgi:hypothetical protein
MSALAQPLFRAPYSEAVQSDDLVDLSRIYQDEVNLCVIERCIDPRIESFIDSLLASPQEISEIHNLSIADFDFSALIPHASNIDGYLEFYRDAAMLATLFCDLFELERVGLRLRTLYRPMCPKFHVDHVPCRMVSTYGGIGTEWLEDRAVDRAKLGINTHGLNDRQAGVILDESSIHRMPAFSVGLLKGSNWAGNEQHGAVHRSPKPSEDCPRRLLLTLDFA